MQKNGFIRCVYGIYDNSHRLLARRQKIDTDIARIKKNEFNEPFKVYIFGKDNFERITALGFDCVLVSDDPAPFDLIKHQYRNKMELIKYALEHDFESVVYMDWDVRPKKKIEDLENFWKTFHDRGEFSACLQYYGNIKCPWRINNETGDGRTSRHQVGNGGCVFFKSKEVINESIQCWEDVDMPDNDELGYAKYVDKKMNGWKGMEYFWNKYENMFCKLRKMSAFRSDKLVEKNVYFEHYL